MDLVSDVFDKFSDGGRIAQASLRLILQRIGLPEHAVAQLLVLLPSDGKTFLCKDLLTFVDDVVAPPSYPNAVLVRPAIQNHAWGKPWEASLVARLSESPEHPLDRSCAYAELWLGTHPNGPSDVKLLAPDGYGNKVSSLKEMIAASPQHWLGEDAARGDLPYLLKILSVNQALSIQAHPHKQLAEYLHSSFPDRYKDANHKPEIALPLGDFEALVGFRPLEEIRQHIREVRELQRLLGDKLQLKLKDLYSRLMRAEPAAVAQQVASLVHRLCRREESTLSAEERLILRLQKDYPGDVGIFSVYFLNYVHIKADMPNSFIYCAPNEPHAYLSGDCVECMALSDNVVRAGLTPKFKDVETLLGMMTYQDDRLTQLVGRGERFAQNIVKYEPPVEDFKVFGLHGGSPVDPLYLPRAAICICVKGAFSVKFAASNFLSGAAPQVEEVSFGRAFFCRAGTTLQVTKSQAGSQLFVATY
eukprot:TRINITY_DN92046_c0_g1_i1.p1 TRINITY_DN92046_c0_g1~~TRINITY_DN92046_c0_g1_i1.p1  ORF type:complete len:474 (+),score=91.49 TRINITY_DN92046_c0_g1_i1:123-1544(+)